MFDNSNRDSSDGKGGAVFSGGAAEVKSVVKPRLVVQPELGMEELRQTALVCFGYCHSKCFEIHFRRRREDAF